MNNNKVKEISNQVIDIQIDAIRKLKGSIDADFEKDNPMNWGYGFDEP